MKENLLIEFGGKKIEHKQLFKTLKEIWSSQGNKIKELKDVELFYKPEENACYYVINSEITGKFEI